MIVKWVLTSLVHRIKTYRVHGVDQYGVESEQDLHVFSAEQYDIVPERTDEDFQRGYQARMDRVKDRHTHEVDLDLPSGEQETW